MLNAIVQAAQVAVHPAKDDFIVVNGRSGTELTFTGLGGRNCIYPVHPRPDQQVGARISFARAGLQ